MLVASAGLLLVGGVATGWMVGRDGGGGRQEVVAERGRAVMPFDLDRTTHRFTPTATGGTQDVVADEPGDDAQVRLIRQHLKEEAAAFGRGDFGDPASIHGGDMPGLKELTEGYGRVDVRYAERPDGATLTYTTREPALVEALHQWFDAQLGDHGGHAEEGGHAS
ncbi:hypothetical protein GCM10023237_31180 [Streptomyces coeruleoprunus]